jgi:hypothetical protein
VVNSTDIDRELVWEGDIDPVVSWVNADDQPVLPGNSSLCIQSRKWIWGRQR